MVSPCVSTPDYVRFYGSRGPLNGGGRARQKPHVRYRANEFTDGRVEFSLNNIFKRRREAATVFDIHSFEGLMKSLSS